MDDFAIVFARAARKEVEGLGAGLVSRIIDAIEALGRIPRPRGCRKLRGTENVWRIRVGQYRIIYSIDDTTRVIRIVAVRHRREAYE